MRTRTYAYGEPRVRQYDECACVGGEDPEEEDVAQLAARSHDDRGPGEVRKERAK